MLSGPQHVFEYSNPAYQELIGHADLQGRRVTDVFPWAVAQGYLALLDRVYQTGEPYVARGAPLNVPERSSALQRYLDFVYQPVRGGDGAVVGILVMGSDVTEQHHAEAALQASEQRLRIASEAAALGIYELDLQAQTLHWDARMQGLWGSDQVGSLSHERMIEGVHPQDRQRKRDALQRAADPAGGGHFQCEYRVVDPVAGVTRWIHAHGRVLFDGGQPTRVVGTVQDISERKEADARRDEFLATLGHELRNPLAPIGNALKVLHRGVAPSGSTGHALAVVDRQYRHVVRLLDDLLDAVRLQHGRFALRKSRVTLAEVVEQARETASAQLEEGGNRIEQRLPPQTVWLDADAVRLAQVVSNLLINASKYSDNGSVIELVAERRGDDGLRLAVRDAGIGIEPAFLERVFETFSQSQPALERSQGGLGIGLALARGIVGLHGGRITAHSAGPGCGSEFVLELPLAAQRSAAPRSARPVVPALGPMVQTAGDASADMRLAGHRILLVEDNHDHAETLSVLLGLYGALVRWAADGLSALDAACEQRPHTILLDLGLPELNGYEVCRRLRGQPWGKSIRIFALTGWGQPADRERTRESGFDEHLLKPVDFDALLARLTR